MTRPPPFQARADGTVRRRAVGAAPRGGHRGAVVRRLLVAASVVAIALLAPLAAVTWGPHLARDRIARVIGEQIGRPVSIGRIEVSPFAGRVTVDDLRIDAADGREPLLTLKRGTAVVELRSLFARVPHVREIRLESPYASVARVGPDRLDVSDIVERNRSTAATNSPRAQWRIDRLSVDGARIRFDDRVARKLTQVDALGLELTGLGTRPADVGQPAALRARFALDGRPVEIDADATPFADAPAIDARLQLDAQPVVPWLAYVALPADVRPVAGTVDAVLRVALRPSADAPPQRLRVAGTVSLAGATVRDADGRDRVAVGGLSARLAESSPLGGAIRVEELRIVGPALALARGADGRLDWPRTKGSADASPSSAPAAQPASPRSPTGSAALPAPSLRIDRILVEDARIGYDDASLAAPLTLRIEPLRVAADAIEIADLRRPGVVRGSARIDATVDGATRAGADVALEGTAGRMRVDVAGIDLPRYAPLAGPALKARVARGALDARATLGWDTDGERWSVAEGAAELADLQVEHADRTPVALRRATIAGVALDPASRRVEIGTVAVDGASVALRRARDGRLDAQDWYVPAAAGDSAGAAPAPPDGAPAWDLRIGEASFASVVVDYEDAALPRERRLPRVTLNAKAREVSLDPARTLPFEASVALADGSRLVASGTVRPQPVRLDTQVRLRRFTLTHFDPYVSPFVNLSLAAGQLWGNGRLAYGADDDGGIARIAFDGELSANDFRAIDKVTSDDFLRFTALAMPSVKVDWRPERMRDSLVEIGAIAFVDFYSRVILGADGRLNLSQVLVDRDRSPQSLTQAPAAAPGGATASARRASARDEDAQRRDLTLGELGGVRDGPSGGPSAFRATVGTPAEGPTIRIGTVRIASGNVDFTDLFIRPNFSANLTRLVGSIDAIASDRDAPSDVLITGSVDNDTPLEITGKIHPLAPGRLVDLRAIARGFDLPKLSTYSGRWAGYAIEKGKLTADVRYTIEGDQLEATNRLVINQLTFGEKVDSPDAPNLPVQLAVSLLKDRNGNIELDLPISGSISDPQFSVGSLIAKALGNAFLNVVASPFTFLASLVGGGQAELSHLAFPAGGTVLDDEARRRLDALAKALADRPALSLDIAGYADPKADLEAMQRQRLEQSLRSTKLARMKRENPTAELPALREVEFADGERAELMERAWRDARLDAGGAKPPPPDELERLLLQRTNVANEDVRTVALQRAQAARDYLRDERGLSNERLYLLAPRLAEPGGTLPAQRTEFAIK